MARSAVALTPQDIRDHLEAVPGLRFPDELKDAKLRAVIQRKTAHVLRCRGIDALPRKDSQERDIINDAVLALVTIEIKRYLRPDEPEFLRALIEEEKLVNRQVSIVESTSRISGFRFQLIGGGRD